MKIVIHCGRVMADSYCQPEDVESNIELLQNFVLVSYLVNSAIDMLREDGKLPPAYELVTQRALGKFEYWIEVLEDLETTSADLSLPPHERYLAVKDKLNEHRVLSR